MTYVSAARIERLAGDVCRRHHLEPGFDVERLLDELDLDLLWDAIADEEGRAVLGQLLPEARLVMMNERHRDRLEAKQGRLGRFTLGHEVGHWMLHCAASQVPGSALPGGRSRSHGTSSEEWQADRFSAALLMPEERVLAELPVAPWEGWPQVYRLADVFLVTVSSMARRLEELGCMRRGGDGVPVSGRLRPVEQDVLFDPNGPGPQS